MKYITFLGLIFGFLFLSSCKDKDCNDDSPFPVLAEGIKRLRYLESPVACTSLFKVDGNL